MNNWLCRCHSIYLYRFLCGTDLLSLNSRVKRHFPLFQPDPTGPFSEAGLLLKEPLSSDNQGALLPSLGVADCVTTVLALKLTGLRTSTRCLCAFPRTMRRATWSELKETHRGSNRPRKSCWNSLPVWWVGCDAWEAAGFGLFCSLITFWCKCVPLTHQALGSHDKCEFLFTDVFLYSLGHPFSVNLEWILSRGEEGQCWQVNCQAANW